MSITLNISSEAEQALRQAWGEQLDRAALEALATDGYRTGKFGTGMVCQILGLESRWDAEEWLAKRGLCRNYSVEDLEADRRTLASLSGEDA